MDAIPSAPAFLRTGGYCRLRCGRVVGPLVFETAADGGWPWRAGRFAFVADGRYAVNSQNHPHDAVGPALESDRLDHDDLSALVRELCALRADDGSRVALPDRIERAAAAIVDVLEARSSAPAIGRRRLRKAVRDIVCAANAAERRPGVRIDARVARTSTRIRSGLRLALAWPPRPATPGSETHAPAPAAVRPAVAERSVSHA